MEGKINLKLVGIIVVVIIVLIALFYFVVLDKPEPDKQGFTALERYDGVLWTLEHRYYQNPGDYRLILVEPVDYLDNKSYMLDDGRFDAISYVFSRAAFGNSPSSGYMIIAMDNGYTGSNYTHPYYLEKYNITHLSDIGEDYTITDWNVDSDEAFDIAMTDDDFSNFMDLDPGLEKFALSASTGKAIWYMHWQSGDNSAIIEIDANTGEVLLLEV